MFISFVSIYVCTDEIVCPYGCYYESLHLPGGQLVSEKFGCDVRCETSLAPTDRCRQVNYVTVYLLQLQ